MTPPPTPITSARNNNNNRQRHRQRHRQCRRHPAVQVKINRPVLRVPTLAIHLTKADERSSFSPNLQNNFFPVLATEVKAKLAAKKGGEATTEGEDEGGGGGVGGGRKDERHHALLVEMLSAELG